jgi:DnaJ-class molecular chaperone
MTREEAYEILGLSADPLENIKKAYLKLSKENHPDHGGDPEKFLKIHAAYMVLTELEKPSEYRQETIEAQVQLSLEEAIFGTTVETHIRQKTVFANRFITQASEQKSQANVNVVTFVEKIPPKILLEKPFYQKIYKDQNVGQATRDVKITYTIKEHSRYKPSPDQKLGLLLVEEEIPIEVALEGGLLEIETLYGLRKLHITPCTHIGDIYEIKNHGDLGSLLIIISAFKMPTKTSSSEEQEKINKIWEKEVELEEKQLQENKELEIKLKNQKT